MQTVAGFFDDYTTAQRVREALLAEGFGVDQVRVEANHTMANELPDVATGSTARRASDDSIGDRISDSFNSLFGADHTDEERSFYADAMRRGNALVTVAADDASVERAEAIIEQFNPINLDERRAAYSRQETMDVVTAGAAGDEAREALPIVEEQLAIGKRAVERGGVRIVRRVTERPVEETVRLREERINVERRPADRALTDTDMTAFREGAIEVTEMAEEAVVSKQARVVEEVVINKGVIERDETIRDTVRRADVDVEQIPAAERRRTQGSGR